MSAPDPLTDGIDDLASRYGRVGRTRRPLLIGAVVALAVVSLGWLAWAAWDNGTPQAESAVVGFTVRDEHTVTVEVDVRLDDGDAEATCRVSATAADKTPVGELDFSPTEGSQEVTVRTERRATSVDVGCTTPDQRRPR